MSATSSEIALRAGLSPSQCRPWSEASEYLISPCGQERWLEWISGDNSDPGCVELLREGLSTTSVGPHSVWDWEQAAWNWVGWVPAERFKCFCVCAMEILLFRCVGQFGEPRSICVSSAWNLGALFHCAFESVAVDTVWGKMLQYVCVMLLWPAWSEQVSSFL